MLQTQSTWQMNADSSFDSPECVTHIASPNMSPWCHALLLCFIYKCYCHRSGVYHVCLWQPRCCASLYRNMLSLNQVSAMTCGAVYLVCLAGYLWSLCNHCDCRSHMVIALYKVAHDGLHTPQKFFLEVTTRWHCPVVPKSACA